MASDAVGAITQDHRVLEDLFERCRTDIAERPALIAEIKARLTAHSAAEEDHVYPAILHMRRGEEDEVYHGIAEHRAAEDLLAQLETIDPEATGFDDALAEFVAAVTHHVEEEENDILPALQEAVDKATLQELGAAFEERRVEMLHEFGLEARRTTGDLSEMTKAELYEQAKRADVPGRSHMSKEELARALRE